MKLLSLASLSMALLTLSLHVMGGGLQQPQDTTPAQGAAPAGARGGRGREREEPRWPTVPGTSVRAKTVCM